MSLLCFLEEINRFLFTFWFYGFETIFKVVQPLFFMRKSLTPNLRNGSTDRGKQPYKSKYRCFTPRSNGKRLCSGPFFALNLDTSFWNNVNFIKGRLWAFQRVEGRWRFHFWQSNRKYWKIRLLDWKCYRWQEINRTRWMWDLWATWFFRDPKVQPNFESPETTSCIWILSRKFLTYFRDLWHHD